MLELPTGDDKAVFIGIDPGTSFPGVGIIHYDPVYKKITRAAGIVLRLERYSRNSDYAGYQTDRFLKLEVLSEYLSNLFYTLKPVRIACEHPFINPRRPGAAIPLAESMFVVEQCVYRYNPMLSLDKIDPSTIKKTVGVSGISKDKNDMANGISKIPELMDVLVNDIKTMDNNAVDGLSVAYCTLLRELKIP